MSDWTNISTLNRVKVNLGMYQFILEKEDADQAAARKNLKAHLNGRGVDSEKIDHYVRIIYDIGSLLDYRLSKYPIYVQEFYPTASSSISQEEVLQYHIHSFLSDVYVLRENLKRVVGKLRKECTDDTKKQNLNDIKTEIEKALKSLTNVRSEHVHEGVYRDNVLMEAFNYRQLKEILEKEFENPRREKLDELEQQAELTFQQAKLYWFYQTEDVKEDLYDLTEWVLNQIESDLYVALDLDPKNDLTGDVLR